MRTPLVVFSALLLAAAPPVGEIYQIDSTHASVGFTVRLAGFNRVRGSFQRFDGHITWDAERPEHSSASVAIEVGSINTGSRERDDHLKAADFFDAGRFPLIRFASSSVQRSAAGLVVEGQLTIRDVTLPVRMIAEPVSGEAMDPFGNRRVAFAATLRLSRSAFGVNGPPFWSRAISDSVDIELEIPGRIWSYDRLAWPRGRQSIGQRLLAVRDSSGMAAALREGRRMWSQPNRDSVSLFSAFEFQKAAGRLDQAGHTRDAVAVLEFAMETIGTAPSVTTAWILALKAQLERKLGDEAAARRSIARSLEMDGANTLALELRRFNN